MDNTFKHPIKLKVDKANGIVHMSVRASEYKVEVFKISLTDISSLISQFKIQMREQEDIVTIVPTNNEDLSE